MKWGVTQLIIGTVAWTLLIGVLIYHFETKPPVPKRRRIRRTHKVVQNELYPYYDQELPPWLQDSDPVVWTQRKKRVKPVQMKTHEKDDSISNLLMEVVDERVAKQQGGHKTAFRAGRAKKRETPIGNNVVDQLAAMLVNYKKIRNVRPKEHMEG